MYRGRGRGLGRRGGRAYYQNEEHHPTRVARAALETHSLTNIDEIFYASAQIKDPRIPEALLSWNLKDMVLDVTILQTTKKVRAKPVDRRRHRAIVLVGDCNGHVGVGVSSGMDAAHAIRAAKQAAQGGMIPVQRGYYSKKKLGRPHTVPFKVTGSCGGAKVSLHPAPRGSAFGGGYEMRYILSYAGIDDVLVKIHHPHGSSNSRHNIIMATFDALSRISATATLERPELWGQDGIKDKAIASGFWPVAEGVGGPSYWREEGKEGEKEKEKEEGEKEKEKEEGEKEKEKEETDGKEKEKEEVTERVVLSGEEQESFEKALVEMVAISQTEEARKVEDAGEDKKETEN